MILYPCILIDFYALRLRLHLLVKAIIRNKDVSNINKSILTAIT